MEVFRRCGFLRRWGAILRRWGDSSKNPLSSKNPAHLRRIPIYDLRARRSKKTFYLRSSNHKIVEYRIYNLRSSSSPDVRSSVVNGLKIGRKRGDRTSSEMEGLEQRLPFHVSYAGIWIFCSIFHRGDWSGDRDRPSTLSCEDQRTCHLRPPAQTNMSKIGSKTGRGGKFEFSLKMCSSSKRGGFFDMCSSSKRGGFFDIRARKSYNPPSSIVETCRIPNPDIPQAGRVGARGGVAGRGRAGRDADRTVRLGDKRPSFPPRHRRHLS